MGGRSGNGVVLVSPAGDWKTVGLAPAVPTAAHSVTLAFDSAVHDRKHCDGRCVCRRHAQQLRVLGGTLPPNPARVKLDHQHFMSFKVLQFHFLLKGG